MKFQLTLRDFFWLTIVVGLAIGLLLEHQDVQRLSGFRGKAEWWEKVARELGNEYQEKTGLKPEFKEMHGVDLRRKDGLLQFEDFAPDRIRVSSTEEQSSSWLSGNADFDIVITLGALCLGPMALVLIFSWLAPRPASAQSVPAPVRPVNWQGYWFFGGFGAMFLIGSVAMFVFRQPFKGTYGLFYGFWFLSYLVPRTVLARFFALPPDEATESTPNAA